MVDYIYKFDMDKKYHVRVTKDTEGVRLSVYNLDDRLNPVPLFTCLTEMYGAHQSGSASPNDDEMDDIMRWEGIALAWADGEL